jgi:predicted ATPase/DNA-binding CsgD family transcriptional regulator
MDLGPVREPSRVAELVASTLQVLVEPVAGPTRALTSQLADRRLLVCLDNCEHLLDPSADLAAALLRSCPEVAVLATSREPLGVPGEIVWRVPSMAEDEAVQLFVERAAQACPGRDGETERSVARSICRRLDGLPLAIELAASWARTLTPSRIAAGLDDRFRLLSGGPRGLIARQETVAASVAWSHDLLEPLEQVVFRRLGVFAGGFTIEAARDVCSGEPVAPGAVLPAVRRLVDASLVVARHAGDEARYRLLETIRQYAQDRLDDAGEAATTRDRHLDHVLALAEAAEPQLEGVDQDRWLARLEAEHDNLRSALDWGLSAADPERGRRLAATLHRLWVLHGHAREGIGYLERALAAAPDDRSSVQTRLLVGASFLGATAGRPELTIDAAQRGLDLAIANDDHRHRARCLGMQAYINVHVNPDGARALCAEARHHAEIAGDELAADMAFMLEGLALTNGDRHDEAGPVLASAAERSRRRGDRVLTAFVLVGQAFGALSTGDVRRASQLCVEAVCLGEPLGDYQTVGSTVSTLAWATGMAGDLDAAWRLMDPVVRSLEDDDAVDAPTMAVTLGKLHLWSGDLASAVRWLTRAAAGYADSFADSVIVAWALPDLAQAYRRLGDADAARQHADRAVELARRLDVPHALAEGLDETAILTAPDDPDDAERLHHEALAIRIRHRLRTYYPDSFDHLGHQAFRAERHLDAARLYGASDAARNQIGYPRPRLEEAEHEAAVDALRVALGRERCDAALSEGASLSLDDAVTYVSRTRGPRGRPSIGWASLTPTERDVVELVAQGLTNPQIGARLLMSRNTVKTHLAHIYAKLDIANRTELAARAPAGPGP